MQKASKLKKIILGIAIAIVLSFFWGYGVNTFYKEPRLNEYCEGIQRELKVDSCEDYNSTEAVKGPIPVGKGCYCRDIDPNGTTQCYAQNPKYQKCNEEYRDARETHNRFSFIILIILGLLSVIIGGLFLGVEAVGNGIMGGGVITLIYGTTRYWGSIQDYARLLILGIALAVLIWIGYRKLKD